MTARVADQARSRLHFPKLKLAADLRRLGAVASSAGAGADRAAAVSFTQPAPVTTALVENPAMYLVEIEEGREQVYQSVEALAAAIRGGVIGPDSRIFHRASSSWVSITLHPEYRKAVAERAQEPLPPLSRKQWTFFGVETPGREIIETAEVESQPASAAEPKPRRGLRALFGRVRRSSSSSPSSSEKSGS